MILNHDDLLFQSVSVTKQALPVFSKIVLASCSTSHFCMDKDYYMSKHLILVYFYYLFKHHKREITLVH